jgi:hypothetical protein
MLSTLGAAALHDGQLLPKKNSTTTLLLKLESATSDPSKDFKENEGALTPIVSGSLISSSFFEHDVSTNAKIRRLTRVLDANISDPIPNLLFCFI